MRIALISACVGQTPMETLLDKSYFDTERLQTKSCYTLDIKQIDGPGPITLCPEGFSIQTT